VKTSSGTRGLTIDKGETNLKKRPISSLAILWPVMKAKNASVSLLASISFPGRHIQRLHSVHFYTVAEPFCPSVSDIDILIKT
jgi:hypothetical protein